MNNRNNISSSIDAFLTPRDVSSALLKYYKNQPLWWQFLALFMTLEESPILALKKFIDERSNRSESFSGKELFELIKILFSSEAMKQSGNAGLAFDTIRSIFPATLRDIFITFLKENILTEENYIALLQSANLEDLAVSLVAINKNPLGFTSTELKYIRAHPNPKSATQAFVALFLSNLEITSEHLSLIQTSISPLERINELLITRQTSMQPPQVNAAHSSPLYHRKSHNSNSSRSTTIQYSNVKP